MKHNIHSDRSIPIDDQKLRDIIARTSDEESWQFTDYLCDMIMTKTGEKKQPSINSIAKKASLGRNQLTRFPVKRKNLLKVCRAYDLTLEETASLFSRNGLYLSLFKNSDRDYIESHPDYKDAGSLPDHINTQPHTIRILDLIMSHKYVMRTPDHKITPDHRISLDPDFCKNINAFKDQISSLGSPEDLPDEVINDLINSLAKIIHNEAKKYLWIVLEKKDPLTDSKNKTTNSKNETNRETVFEIASVLDFDRDETEQLYRSYGYTLCPDHLRFDAFVVWLMEQGYSRNDHGYIYKSICSNMDQVHTGTWTCKAPDIDDIDKMLLLKNSRAKTLVKSQPDTDEPVF